MNNLDLNIDNYNLNDLLNLFKLKHNFSKDELKQAKKIVMRVHPDKSKLDKEYFIFFTKAFKIIYSIYEFRNQSCIKRPTEYYVEKDDEKEILLKDISKSKNFNKIFNELFEKNYIKEDENENGYGDWLKEIDNDNLEITNINDLHKEIEKKKQKASSLIVKNDIQDLTLNNYKDLTGDTPVSYSSDIFSSLNYEDIKKAHTETIIPVCENDYIQKQKFKNINDIQSFRNKQNIKPLSEQQALEYLNKKQNDENKLSTIRAYKLAKQQEINNKINEKWMSEFKRLKDS